MADQERINRLAEGLGASRVVDLESRPGSGPLDLLSLRQEVTARLRSSGGRPSDPEWTISRQVPFKPESWRKLQHLATRVAVSDRRVAASQLAAIILEFGLEEAQSSEWAEIVERDRASLMTANDASTAAGVTFRQWETWRKDGVVKPARVEGRLRWYTAETVVRMIWLRRATENHPGHEGLKRQILDADLSHRYLVITDGELVRTAPTQRDLSALLMERGSHNVTDQVTLRVPLHDQANEGAGGEDEGDSAAV